MSRRSICIGVVAPAARLDESAAQRVTDLALREFAGSVDLRFHRQCFRRHGHFAGTDLERADAFVEYANDPTVDAVWFARGGYGSVRIVDMVLDRLSIASRNKTYLGYSDLGSLLGALYAQRYANIVHGPMPADILRPNGEAAVLRSLSYLLERSSAGLEPSLKTGGKAIAFNMMIFCRLIGTPHFPDVSAHVLMLEEVSEYMYSIDRMMAHIASCPPARQLAGIRLGRCSLIPPNDPDFGKSETEVVQDWCLRSGIPYLGRADIGHDSDNKIVPFGAYAAELLVS
ncbi:MAG: LD-carboxypeptidase [Micropepsaceae bacterium]